MNVPNAEINPDMNRIIPVNAQNSDAHVIVRPELKLSTGE
jgi:hypothetical protein